MAKFEVKCTRPGCGQGLETPDVDEMMAWSAAHDEHCLSLKAQEIAPETIAEAVSPDRLEELRGVVRDMRTIADQPEWTAPPEAVIAFLDGDGCDDEAFASLRRRLTLATPWILDSAAGTAYTARKLAEAEKRGAVNILRHVADRTAAQLTRGEPLAKTVDEAMMQAIDGLRSIADRTERDGMPGEVTLP